MMKRLGLDKELFASAISGYEIGTREPPIPVLLNYARIACIPMEMLADDDLDLPEPLPPSSRYKLIMKRVPR